MEQEYAFGKGWRIASYVIAGFFILLGLSAAIFSFKNAPVLVLIVSPLLVFLGVYLLLSANRYKLITTEFELIERRAFKQRRLAFSDAKGYRTTPKQLIVYPANSTAKRITINSYQYFSNYPQLLGTLRKHMPDLDAQEYAADVEVIKQNQTLGATADERTAYVKKVKTQAFIVNALGIVVAAAAFVGHLFLYVAWGIVAYPFVLLLFFYQYRNVMNFKDSRAKDAYPSLIGGLLFPPIIMIVFLLLNFEVLHVKDCLLICGGSLLALIVLFAAIIQTQEPEMRKRNSWPILIASLALYSMAAPMGINFAADRSNPQLYQAKVTKLSVSHGKSTTYHVSLSAWGPLAEENDTTVDQDTFNQLQVGGNVDVYLKRGYLHIPWYFIYPEQR